MAFEGTVGGVDTMEKLTLSGPSAGVPLLGAHSGGASVAFVASHPNGKPLELSGGVLMFPNDSQNAGKVWCIDGGSLLADGSRPSGAFIGRCSASVRELQ
jgi:hypothetical protein